MSSSVELTSYLVIDMKDAVVSGIACLIYLQFYFIKGFQVEIVVTQGSVFRIRSSLQ